jgi:hypothetical protein
MPLFSIKQENLSDTCWFAVQCLARLHEECYMREDLTKYISIIEVQCPDFMFIPSVPILFNDIYLIYIKNQTRNVINNTYLNFYLCSKNSFYENYFFNQKKFIFKDFLCYRNISWQFDSHIKDIFKYEYGSIHGYNPFWKYSPEICQKSNMYQCQNSSKCISFNRLNDGIDDCMYSDDEDENILEKQTLTKYFQQTHYQCSTPKKYIPGWAVNDDICNCAFGEPRICDDEPFDSLQLLSSSYGIHNICDGFIDSKPILIDGKIHTDETECENWPCHNYYTHCNQIWNCLNGEDELNCESEWSINCSTNHHICKSIDDGHLICLPLEKVNDDISDCHGSIDESKLCKRDMPSFLYGNFQCRNKSINRCIPSYDICNEIKTCLDGDDEEFCNEESHHLISYQNTQFQFHDKEIFDSNQPHCNQGISLRVWLNKKENLFKKVCLCPLHFYGNECQYQNQRVNLYVQFQSFYNSYRSVFHAIVLLIDDSNEQVIHSHKQFIFQKYMGGEDDCEISFYYLASLIYSTRPKDLLKNYSIHINIYEKISLSYFGSFLIPIEYSFLPVHRITKIFYIPRNNRSMKYCSNRQCNYHGKCIQYLNQTNEKSFCQCERGWRGKSCLISYHCSCSSDSLCLGISAMNRSVCVCPVNRMGPRCLLTDLSCQMYGQYVCENGGQCIPHYEMFHRSQRSYSCVCRKGFSGYFCDRSDINITLSFGKEVIISPTIHIHLFWNIHNQFSHRTTIPVRISNKQNSSVIYWKYEFHLVIVQSFSPDHYYFVDMRRSEQISESITKMITSSDRCLHLNQFLPETIYNLHFLRRVKYYYFICQTYSPNVSCFYDYDNFCTCDYVNEQRYPYCFKYENDLPVLPKLDAMECYSGGQLVQDAIECPSKLWCLCPQCFYGTQCQFTTSGFGLSLDSILTYHIEPHVKLIHQPVLVQVTAGLCIIFIIIGFVNGLLSLITFKNKVVCEVGCGVYLLVSSITTLLTMTFFGLKVWILLLAQMSIIENRTFLTIQCYSIDFFLRFCLYTDQWLNACVALERAVCTIKGTGFNKNKSRRVAKVMIIILLIFNIGTSIHDPIYRELIDGERSFEDDDDYIPQLYCIINYKSASLSTYNNIMHTFNFFGPFLVNFLSAIILITKKSIQRANVQSHRNFFDILLEQSHEHKHLLIAPIVLVILAIPRLIIAYTTKCMESQDDAWLYLMAYFIPFTSTMLTFVIFVVPSEFYKKEFRKAVQQIRRNIQRRLRIIP